MADSKDGGQLLNCDRTCKRRVVIACDGSDNSTRALNFFFDSVMNVDDHIFLYHAFELPSMPSAPYPYGYSYYEDWTKTVKDADQHAINVLKTTGEEFNKKARKRFPEENKDHVTKPHIQLYKETGRAGEVICQFCKDVEASLLVLGSRGQSTLKRVVLGSVSDYCIHHNDTHVPIIVVPPPLTHTEEQHEKHEDHKHPDEKECHQEQKACHQEQKA